jgi:site-specific recombinase XerD
MATVSIILREDKIKKDGTAPIHFLIIKDRKKTKISSGISILPKYWDKKGKVKPGAKNSARINSMLQNKFTELQDRVFEHETISKSLTTRQLKEKIYGKKPMAFFPFADEVIQQYKIENKIGTHHRTQTVINKFKEYIGNASLDFQDITPDLLKKYEKHLRTDLGNKTNSIHSNLKFFRKLFNDAVNQNLVEYEQNPFRTYKLKTEKTTREYLTEDELTAFANVDTNADTRLDLHKDMFVFAAYTGGLRVSDVLQLRWQNFDGTYIHFKIQKTSSQLSIKVPDTALNIINKYKPKKPTSTHFIFPMLNNDLDTKDLVLLDRSISGATAYINKNLKIIAKKAEIEKNISFHISRHTWATRALRKGITIDKVSKLMGHAQIKETQIYAKIVSQELDKAMDVFND